MSLSVGQQVKCTAYTDYKGTSLASFVRTNVYVVQEIYGPNRGHPEGTVRFGLVLGGDTTAVVWEKELSPINPTPIPTPEEEVPAWVTNPEIDPETGLLGTVEEEITLDDLSNQTPLTNEPYISTSDSNLVLYLGKPGTSYNAGGYAERFISADFPKRVKHYTDGISYVSDYMDYNDFYWTLSKSDRENARELYEEYLFNLNDTISDKVFLNHPDIIQNAYAFPKTYPSVNVGRYGYKYDYSMNYSEDILYVERDGTVHYVDEDISEIKDYANLNLTNRSEVRRKMFESYNKHKIQNPNDLLYKSFAHVFFTRPDCNIFNNSFDVKTNPELNGYLRTNPEFLYALKHCPNVLRQLTQGDAGYGHEFALYLSNQARSFEISDEYIETAEFGAALTGHKVPYGRHSHESRTSGKFSINFLDNRDLYVYQLHKLWIEYISSVYTGKAYPRMDFIKDKILDYAASVYYIVCAEDGETIIFWSKYTGVFPLEAPSSPFSYNADSKETMNMPELKIQYTFAYKEDFNPMSIIEFNQHSINLAADYIPNYQKNILGMSYTWGGAPYIELMDLPDQGLPYTFRLRFRPE